MTKRQRISLMAELWPNACQGQHWREDDRDLRLYVCSIAVSADGAAMPVIKSLQQFRDVLAGGVPIPRVLKSANDIDDDKEFTRVKGLLLMLADDLNGPAELDNPNLNKGRQMRHVIGDLVKCIAVYHPNAEAYVADLIRDKFRHGSRAMPLTVEDLSNEPITLRDGRVIPSQLAQLLMKLTGALHFKGNTTRKPGFRVAAGDSVHDMCLKARIKCHCKDCEGALQEAKREAEPVPAGVEDNEPF